MHSKESNESASPLPMIKANPIPATIGTPYTSVMVYGEIHMLAELREKTAVLQAMLEKFVPGYFDSELSEKHVDTYRSSLGSKRLSIVSNLTK